MSRFGGPPRDTDRRPYFHHEPRYDDRDRPFRAPPGGDRPPWPDRPDWPHRPPADWPPPRPAASDWPPPPRPAGSHWSPDGALSVLSSCGLDARDLSLLSELPEDMLTLKSLPQLLSQIKQKKDPYLPPGLDPLPPIDQSQAPYPGPALGPPDPGLYREPGPSQSAFVVDYEHRTSDLDYRSKSPERFSALGSSADRGRSFERKPPSVPSETQARDFHGKKPTDFPYSCSLCDITVLSENVWTQHINTTLHADRQLSLLQRFPKWDCRVNSARRDGKQAAKQEKKSKKEKELKQTPKKGKVVCVKFPARAVDESYLRNLTKDFGQILNIAMFPSLGFIEMETPDQAANLIASFSLSPHKVEEQELEFTISTTFNFLQSSFVLNFFPVPFGNDGKRDLLAIIKRFGTPLYTMFITDTMHAYIEMQNAADAHKMVEYYSTTPLKMNGVNIIVSFSQEFRTLARCARAKPYEENEENKPEAATPKTTVVKKKTVKKAAAESQAGSEAPSAQPESEEQKKDENTEAEAKSEDGKEPSEGGSDMDIDGVEVAGAKLDDEEEDSGLPPNLDNCITLDEVSDNEEAAAEAPVEEEEEEEEEETESEDSPRVVYIGNLPLCRFSDPQFIKMVQLVHRPVRYFINRQQRMGLAEFASRTQAREFVAKMQDYSFGGCCLTTFISNKYNRLPWGRGVEYDEHGRIMRHFRIGKSPEREKTLAMPTASPPRHSRRRSKDRDSPRAKKHRERSRSRGKSRARSRDRSRDRSRGKQRLKSRERSRDRSRGKSRARSRSRDRSRGKSKGRSRERSRERSRGRSRGRSRSRARSRGRSRERSRDRREKSRTPTSRDKPPPSGDGEASKEAESGRDKGVDIRIENVVSLKDPAEPNRDQADRGASEKTSVEEGKEKEQESQEEGWTVANLNTEEEAEKTDGEKKKVSDKEEEKKRKDDTGDGEKDSTKTAGGATEARVPTKPVGTEFIRFYCALCHVMYSEQQEARAHCSTIQHYHKYKEMTGKDPWSSSD